MDNYANSEIDPVLAQVCNRWKDVIKKAQSHKHEVFGKFAQVAYQFYRGPKCWSDVMCQDSDGLEEGGGGFPDPTFKMSVNKTFEFVTIFGPALYYENPVRTVKPRLPVDIPPDFFPDPYLYQALIQQEQVRLATDTLRAQLVGAYLNWTPQAGLSEESRLAINEALIKGRGCLWPVIETPPGCDYRVVRSEYDSVNNLLVDPDAPSFRKARWIARKRVQPTWDVERRYGLRPGSLKGNLESQHTQAAVAGDPDGEYNRARGLTNDLLVYWEVYSKMGLGGRLKGFRPGLRPALEMFGDYCLIVVCDTCPFPLNLPPDVTEDPSFGSDPASVFARTAWPTPFWAADSWPVAVLDFHEVHESPWPMAHLRAGIGELRFLNWAMSFIAGKLHTSCRDLIAVKKSIGAEMKSTILHGQDRELLELEAEHGTIEELVQILQFPQVNGDVWKMIEAVENNFDKRVGLTELMYGAESTTQIRSAEEANLRSQGMSVRPEDMAKQVEAWQAQVAVMEALLSRYHLGPQDVRPILGAMGAMAWQQYVASADLGTVCHQLEYHIEAGSTQRPNKNAEVRQMTEAMQLLLPVFVQWALTSGDIQPLNNLLADYAKSRDLDSNRYQLHGALPPPAAPGPIAPPHPEAHEPTSAPIPQG